ncbi:hypothetical protein PPACK8108_LOCUS3107 [Phakopsora pachyrhizi]|uniref:Uncharacterized protein n=1 Tax=Phakopsora pachyrhizi TaxID=170000 RepID=A0AAV0AKW5_PHAPC|nr:hypothetical protein PPACK8108_LOCUS3107 [Phakopsora pachyrhizi]
MKIWIREILFASVGFISRLVDEVASSHSFGSVLSKDNVHTQSKQQLNPSRIYSQTETTLSTSNIELEDFRRAGKSKRKFEGVFSTQTEGAQAVNQTPWAQAEFNWDFDYLGSTSYHLGRPRESDNSLVWNAQHRKSPDHYKRLCLTNHLPSSRCEFEDLEDLGNFSQNSDHWNAFIEKLRPESNLGLSEVNKNDAIHLQKSNTISNSRNFKANNTPHHSFYNKENGIAEHLDKIFTTKRKKKLLINKKILVINQVTDAIPDSNLKRGNSQMDQNVDLQSFQGSFWTARKEGPNERRKCYLRNSKKPLESHVAIPAVTPSTAENAGISKTAKKLKEGSRAYERQHLANCLAEFQKLKVEENVFFGGKGNIMAVEEVTMNGLGSFLRGLTKYANSFSPLNNGNKNKKAKFEKYFQEQDIFHEKFYNPFSRFLSHDKKPFDKKLLDEERG